MSSRRPTHRSDFDIAILCALASEYDAVAAVFDEFWDAKPYGRADGDPNQYTVGRLSDHNVILVKLTGMGKLSAMRAAAGIRQSFKSIHLALLVGVCGGIPSSGHADVFLGDVVISRMVVQYDFGRQYPNEFTLKDTPEDTLGRSRPEVRTLIGMLETDHHLNLLRQRTAHHLEQLRKTTDEKSKKGHYHHPGTTEDKLFEPDYRHKHWKPSSCICQDCHNDPDPVCDEALTSSCHDLGCDHRFLSKRDELSLATRLSGPMIHIGTIGSADTVLKSASHRDKMASKSGILAFEMEGAGLWDELPCVIIKAVCDYADSHKHKGWQRYAAGTAASAAKALLEGYTSIDKPPPTVSLALTPSSQFSAMVLSSRARSKRVATPPSESTRLVTPKDRLAERIAVFEDTLKQQHNAQIFALQFNQLRTRPAPAIEDVTVLLNQLGNDCKYKHNGWSSYAMYAAMFLNRVQQFLAIGVFMLGSDRVSSGVWAVIATALDKSLSSLPFFIKVTEMLLRVGRQGLSQGDYTIAMLESEELQSMACEYLIVVMDVCVKIVRHEQSSALSRLASPFHSSFESDFGPSEELLKAIDLQMRRLADVLAAQPDRDSHGLTSQPVKQKLFGSAGPMTKRSEKVRKAKRHRLLSFLSPNQEDFGRMYRQHRRKGQSEWLFSHEAYKDWVASQSSSCLCLRGNLGSGKSIVMASTVAHLLTIHSGQGPKDSKAVFSKTLNATPPTTVSSFFCSAPRATTLQVSTIMASLAYQTIASSSMSPFLVRYLDEREKEEFTEKTRWDAEACVDLLLDITPKSWRGFFIVDGLDACPKDEIDVLFKELGRLWKSARTIHLFCSFRTSWKSVDLVKMTLKNTSVIILEDVDRSSEVESFISSKMNEWKTIRSSLTPKLETLIKKQLHLGWNGMFLWLALQVEFISSDLHSSMAILDLLHNLPGDLPATFDRALLQVADRAFASKVFNLVAAAEAPMTIDELRIAANVNIESVEWQPDSSSSWSFLWHYGGHLLEMDEEDRKVRFIHDSVLQHVLGPATDPRASPFHFHLPEARMYLGRVLITYLNYPALERQVSTAPKVQAVNQRELRQIPNLVAKSVLPANSRAHAALKYVLRGSQQKTQMSIDYQSLLDELDEAKTTARQTEVEGFLEYARANWLTATRLLPLPRTDLVCRQWARLVEGTAGILTLPFEPVRQLHSVAPGVAWALENRHRPVFEFCRDKDAAKTRQIVIDLVGGRVLKSQLTEISFMVVVYAMLMPIDLDSGNNIWGPLSFLSMISLFFAHDDELEQWVDWATLQRERHDRQAATMRILQWIIQYDYDTTLRFRQYLDIMNGFVDLNTSLSNDMTPIEMAIEYADSFGTAERLKILLEMGLDPNAPTNLPDKLGPLLRASVKGYCASITRLLDAGAAINQVDEAGCNALIHAVKAGQKDTVQLLIDRKIAINARNELGQTALHYATMGAETGCLRLLIKAGVALNVQDALDWTAVHYACDNKRASQFEAKVLLPGVNYRSPPKETQWEEMIILLVQAGADTEWRDKGGRAPQYHWYANGSVSGVKLTASVHRVLLRREHSLPRQGR